MFKNFLSSGNVGPENNDESALKWRSFLEYFDGVIAIVGRDRKITFMNRVLEGLDPLEVVGSSPEDWVYKHDREIFIKNLDAVFRDGGLVSFEVRGAAADKMTAWYLVRIGPIREGKNITGAIIISSDITALKQTIEKMEDNKDAMVNLLEDIEKSRMVSENAKVKDEAIILNIGEGLAVIDDSGSVELVNQRLAEMLLSTPSEFVDKKWQEVLIFKYEDNRNVEIGKIPIQQAYDFKTRVTTTPMITSSMRYFLPRVDGKRIPVQVTASPIITDGKVSQVIVVIRDISKEIELEKTKTEFVSIASHQLRTPLSTVNWYTEMLLSGEVGDVNPKQKDYLNEIYAGNQRMIELVNALLNVSRLEVGAFIVEPKMINMKTVVEDVINEAKVQFNDRQIKVETVFDDNLPEVQADQNLARIILQNLITNAMKYTGTKINVSLSLQEGILINQRDRKDSSGILIKISDDGMGIPETQKPQIFTKLFRADNARMKDPQGSGLGLYIVKSIIDQTGGEIWFDSKENSGSTFYVLVPIKWMEKRTGTRRLTEE